MPVYEYECARCGGRIEELQKYSDEPLKKHDGCGGKLKKMLSAPAFQFKGTGWYVTDYAGKGSDRAEKRKQESGLENKGAEAKSESKPEAKSESKNGGGSKPASESKSSKETTAKK